MSTRHDQVGEPLAMPVKGYWNQVRPQAGQWGIIEIRLASAMTVRDHLDQDSYWLYL